MNLALTFGHIDSGMGRKTRLVIVHVDHVNADRGCARHLGDTVVRRYHRKLVRISDFRVQHDIRFDYVRRWRLDNERVIVITVDYVIRNTRIWTRISVDGQKLLRKKEKHNFRSN